MSSKKRPKQSELKGMPEADATGKAAEAYIESVQAVTDAKEDAALKAGQLVALMRQHKRTQIRVQGKLILCKHLDAQDVLKIKKVKEG